jgi:hypothetical protein
MLQLALVALGYAFLNDVLGFRRGAWNCGSGSDGWLLVYQHPLYNLPHFVLGILGGLLRKAGPSLLDASLKAPQSSAWDAQCVWPPPPLPLPCSILCPLSHAVRTK